MIRSSNFFVSIFVLLVLFFGFLSTKNINAHPPSSMVLNYNISTETLEVTISHSVENLETHYIELIEIWKNDILNSTNEYTNQPAITFTYSFHINVSSGDILNVKATCNQGGSAEESITPISGTNESPTENITGYNIWIVNFSFVLIALLANFYHNRKKPIKQ